MVIYLRTGELRWMGNERLQAGANALRHVEGVINDGYKDFQKAENKGPGFPLRSAS